MQKSHLLLCSYRQPRTPERDRQSEREQERLQRQMTSPSVRRQREYDRQLPMPQPHFGAPAVAGPPRVNWQERLEQGFQSRQAQRHQNRGDRHQGQNEGMPAVAGPSVPVEGRVNWGERLEQGLQSRHAQRLRDRGGPLRDQNNRPPQQFIMGRQERYAEEELQHAAHQQAIQRQRQMDHDQEALQHQAHMAELQRQQQHQRDMEALQHQAHLAEMQRQQHQRDMEALQRQAHQEELQQQEQHQREMEAMQHQAHQEELQQQQQHQRQMEALQHQAQQDELQQQQQREREMEALEQQNNATQQQQMDQQAEVERIQVAINNNQALAAIPKACHRYHDPAQRFSLGPMSVECPHCHALHFKSKRLTNSSNIRPRFGLCCLQGQIQLPPLAEPPQLLRQLLTSSTPRARNFRERIRQYNCAFAFTSVAVKVDEAILNRVYLLRKKSFRPAKIPPRLAKLNIASIFRIEYGRPLLLAVCFKFYAKPT